MLLARVSLQHFSLVGLFFYINQFEKNIQGRIKMIKNTHQINQLETVGSTGADTTLFFKKD